MGDDVAQRATELHDIATADYPARADVPDDYGPDDAIRATLDTPRYDRFDTDALYDDLQETDYTQEEIQDALREREDPSSTGRRQLMKNIVSHYAVLDGGLYALGWLANEQRLSSYDADHFEAPAGSYHPAAVQTMLDGEEITIHLYNVRFDDKDPQYDEDGLVTHVEHSIDELDGTRFNVAFHNLNVTPETLLDDNISWRDADAQQRAQVKERYRDYRHSIEHNSVVGTVDEDHRQQRYYIEDMASQMEALIDDVMETPPHTPKDIQVVIGDFKDEDAVGLSTVDHRGDTSWALVNKHSAIFRHAIREATVHELGHKLGLPHTRFPDTKRGGLFPDVMSYWSDDFPLTNKVRETLAGEHAFERQSHYNWERVKEHVRDDT